MAARSLRLALLFLPLAACGPHPIRRTGDVSTRDMSIALDVKNEGGATRVRVKVDGKLPYTGALAVTPGDRLVLRGEHESDATIDLFADPDDDTASVVDTPRTSGTFVVDLLRAGDRPLPGSEATLPAPFTLKAPSDVLSRKGTLELMWDVATGTTSFTTAVSVQGSCTKGFTHHLASDTGAYVLNGGEIPLPPEGVADGCEVTVTVTRTAPWVSSPTLYATASQARTVTVRLSP